VLSKLTLGELEQNAVPLTCAVGGRSSREHSSSPAHLPWSSKTG
jgi:hypothetical protein